MFVHDAARSGGGAVWQWLVSLLKVSGVIVGVGVALVILGMTLPEPQTQRQSKVMTI